MAESFYNISRLLDFYGEMLSDRQKLAAELYYNDDLSLSEISEQLGISRQGVRASLKRSEEILKETERKLGLAAGFDRTVRDFERLRSYAEAEKEKSLQDGDERLAQFAENIVRLVKKVEKDIEEL